MVRTDTVVFDETLLDIGSSWRDLDASTFRILLADDHFNIRRVLEKALSAEGYRVQSVADGVDLLEQVRQEPPDLIALDIMMPRLDGLSALEEIRSDPRLAPTYVILLTARNRTEDKVEGLDAGADDYLTKPFQLEELLARVRAGIRIKAMQRALEESQQQIIRQEKLATIGHLASGISHEFNNIMGAISGFAQLAATNERYLPRLLKVALEQSKRAQKITSSLASFASGTSAGVRTTAVAHLLDSSLCLVAKEVAEKRIEVTTRMPNGLPNIEVDTAQMQQAYVHLLLNAVQATPLGGAIEVRAEVSGHNFIIEIDDGGPGVPDDIRHRIFDPFFTTKGALGSSDVPGNGLGLAFCLNIAQSHRGTLALVPSRLGGACFRLEIPCGSVPVAASVTAGDSRGGTETPEHCDADMADATENDENDENKEQPPSVVVVEDDLALQEVVQELLADEPVAVFADGPAALDFCHKNPVSVVIVDLTLQGPWNGERVLEELSATPQPPPVIVTSGTVDVPNLDDGSFPSCIFLRKPYDLSELERALAEARKLSPQTHRTA